MKTELITDNISAAADIIRGGGLVGVPTETVYGLAGNGLDPAAVGRIYEVKGRPAVKPLSLMVAGAGDIEKYCVDIPPAAYALAKKYWPGPLTIVLKSAPNVPDIVRAGGDTVGLRCPDSERTLRLIELAGVPLAAPSANPSGEKSPVTAAEVMAYFSGAIEAVIDGGPCANAFESTIIDMSKTPYTILRRGALPEDEVFNTLSETLTVIGITGGTGGGKTTALDVLREFGALVIDCDELYHELMASSGDILGELERRFPQAVENGMLQRKKLGAVVFSDPQALLDLNDITHRYVHAEVDRRLTDWARQGGTLAAIDAIALIESGLSRRCRFVAAVTAPAETRVLRLMAREGISRQYAEARISAQRPDSYYAENCDFVLINDGDRLDFTQRCRELFGKILGSLK